MSDKLPVSCVICTLNSEEYLASCLGALLRNNVAEIIVVDGGSRDSTVAIAHAHNVIVHQLDRPGLSSQRQLGLDWVSQPYVALVDAHHVLRSDCLGQLLSEIKLGCYHAIQARELCGIPGYWAEGRTSANKAITYLDGVADTDMVGRPALYRTDALKDCGFDSGFDGVGNEDSDLSIRMQKKGYWQGIGTGIAYRIDGLSFSRMVGKFIKYGRGDARLMKKHPEKRWAIINHLLWIYPVKRSFAAFLQGEGKYIPYYVLCGWIRFVTMIYEWRKR